MRQSTLLVFLAALGLLLAAMSACTSANEQALAKMSGSQRSYLDQTVTRIRAGMNEREVTTLLGPPRSGRGSPRVCYRPPDKDPGEICVRFVLYKAAFVEWTQPGEGGFKYVVDLNEVKD